MRVNLLNCDRAEEDLLSSRRAISARHGISQTERWVNAVNADGSYGCWAYAVAKKPEDVTVCIDAAMAVVAKQ